MPSTPRRQQATWLLPGILLGTLLALNAIAIYAFNTGGTWTVLPCIGTYLYAGYRSTQHNHPLRAGAIAGGMTGVISSLLGGGSMIIVVVTHLDAIRERVQAEANVATPLITVTTTQVLTQRLLGTLAGLILATITGLGIGALGGFLKQQTIARPVEPT